MRRLGGRLVSFHYCLGDWDGVAISEAPDETTALAAMIAGFAPGHLKATRVTRLFSPEEALEAMRRAQEAHFPAPQP